MMFLVHISRLLSHNTKKKQYNYAIVHVYVQAYATTTIRQLVLVHIYYIGLYLVVALQNQA